MKKIVVFFCFIFILVSCSYYSRDNGFYPGTEEYQDLDELPFLDVKDNPYSIISLDTNTAAYSMLRRNILDNATVNKNSVRTEEMVNYFNYQTYQSPVDDNILGLNAKLMECPWNSDNMLLTVGVKTKEVDMSKITNNLVFLIDVSGSMEGALRLDLVKEAFMILIDNLNDHDTISIVTYASSTRVIVEGIPGSDKMHLKNVISELYAGGSTAGASGINLAYQAAEKYFIEDGNNRVILATDGDFNVGISKFSELKDFISAKKETGVYLSVLGFGYGNTKDNKLETLALNGNGNYAYINSKLEAEKVFIQEAMGTLVTVAKDVKAQVIFNSDNVDKYRLIGYENKILTNDDWEDSNKDAGDLGAGRTVTIVYEIKLKSNDYNFGELNIRYKDVGTNEDLEQNYNLDLNNYNLEEVDMDIIFISCVVEFSLILRDSQYKENANINSIINRLEELECVQTDEFKKDFFELVEIYGRCFYND